MTACQLSESCPFRDKHPGDCLPAPRPEPKRPTRSDDAKEEA